MNIIQWLKDLWSPEKGWLCVCEEHFEQIETGLIQVPPLRQNLDYVSTCRKPFLLDSDLNEVKSPNKNGDDFSTSTKALVEAYLNYKNHPMYTNHTDKSSSFITAAPVAPAKEEHGTSQKEKA